MNCWMLKLKYCQIYSIWPNNRKLFPTINVHCQTESETKFFDYLSSEMRKSFSNNILITTWSNWISAWRDIDGIYRALDGCDIDHTTRLLEHSMTNRIVCWMAKKYEYSLQTYRNVNISLILSRMQCNCSEGIMGHT